MENEYIKGLVSLIIPCYNSESCINNILESVNRQTYKNIQLIIVNDGSTDGTEEEIIKFLPELKNNLAEVLYLKQMNGGAGSAVNNALKYVRGEYLAWNDSDDEMLADSIRVRCEYLNSNLDMGMVVGRAIQVDYETGKGIGLMEYENFSSDTLFRDLIYGTIPCFPGVFMLRTKLLFDKLHDRKIVYDSEIGQNWQLLLPVAYDHKCGYIKDYIYIYKVRKGSHSRIAENNYERQIKRTKISEELLYKILEFVKEEDREDVFRDVRISHLIERANIFYLFHKRKEFTECYKELKSLNVTFTWKRKLKFMLAQIGLMK